MYPIFMKNKAYIGRVVEVLVEEQSKVEGILAGRTDTFKLCHFSGSDDLIGQIVELKSPEIILLRERGYVRSNRRGCVNSDDAQYYDLKQQYKDAILMFRLGIL